MTLHQNLIAGEWVGADGVENINPSNTNEVVGLYARATRRGCQDRDRRRQGRLSGLVALRHPRAPRDPEEDRRRDPRPQGRAWNAACPRRGQDACRKPSARPSAPRQIFDFFAGEAPAPCRRSAAVGAPEHRRRDHPRADRRHRHHHARGTSRSPFPPGRSRRRSATATPSSSSRPNWCPAAPGRSSTSSTAPACRRAC